MLVSARTDVDRIRCHMPSRCRLGGFEYGAEATGNVGLTGDDRVGPGLTCGCKESKGEQHCSWS